MATTKAGVAFAAWVAERRKLTDEEISDLEAEIRGLKEGIAPLDLKPKTEYGVAFAQWVLDYGVLTQDDLLDVEAQLQGLKPVKPPEKVPVEKSSAALLTLIKNRLFLGTLEPLKPGESTTDRWLSERNKLTAKQAKDFEAEIKLVEARVKELGWDDPEALQKLTKEAKLEKPKPPTPPKPPTVKPELIIERIPYPKWWKDCLTAKIDFTAPGSQILARVAGKLNLFVATIVISVTEETAITIGFGTAGTSGPIYLGGIDQPRGIVIAMGNSPAPCGDGPLIIAATDPVLVGPSIGGFVTCFVTKD